MRSKDSGRGRRDVIGGQAQAIRLDWKTFDYTLRHKAFNRQPNDMELVFKQWEVCAALVL